MRYPKEIYQRVESELSSRRQSAAAELDGRVLHIQESHPDIRQLRKQASMLGAQMGKALLLGNQEQHDDLLLEMEECRSRIRELLASAGFPSDYLEPRPLCPLCSDRGFVEGRSCDCRNALLNRLAYEWLSNTSRVEECGFDNFRLEYYQGDAARTMGKLLQSCRRYAENFSAGSPSLLFQGPPGLGKTHLSLAIAGAVVKTGRLVLYASAPSLLQRLVDISFNRDAETEYRDIAYGCDLLVIDDLGTEFQTRFTRSEVYGLINTRLIESRPTIVNTNLTIKELAAAYDARVASRLENEYKPNYFTGTDIRYQRRMRK